MKSNLICTAVLIAVGGSCAPLEAQEKSPKAKYNLRLVKQTVIVGEPILAEVVLNEKGKEPLTLATGDISAFGTIKIMDLQGKPVRCLLPVFSKAFLKSLPMRLEIGVLSGYDFVSDKSAGSPFVANRDWVIRQPGKYRIQFTIKGAEYAPERYPSPVLEAVVTVLPLSTSKLRAIADKLMVRAKKH